MEEKKEIWKPIIGYENHYVISNFGRVKSLARTIQSSSRGSFQIKERILSDKIKDVVLRKDGVKKTFDSRRLFLTHFEGYEPNRKTAIVDINDKPKILSRRKITSIAKILTIENKSCKSTGVSKSRGFYFCQLEINGKAVFLGRHETEKQASEIYQFAVIHQNLYKGNSKDFRMQLNVLMCDGKNII